MSVISEIASAIADQLTPISPPLDIQIRPVREFKPTPPCIDIYPATPFLEDATFGGRSVTMRWTVRVRVGANDPDAQIDLLYGFMDPFGDLSIRSALYSDRTLGGIADLVITDETGVQPYQDTLNAPVLPGCEWTLQIWNRPDALS